MQMTLAWVAFPLVLAAIGAGWGVLVERAAGREVHGALLIPLGLLAALLAAAVVTASETTAPAAVAVVAGVGVVGLAVAWPGRRIALWPLLVAIGTLLAYGAPVLLSGQATFTGVNTLDDTATWLGLTDHLFAQARAYEAAPRSSFGHIVHLYLHAAGYPVGGFMLLGVGRGVVGVDAAWVYQPYLACCGVLVGLSAYALLERFVASRPLRAGLAFVAAQPALLYGYGLWGSIKELTAAWVLIAGVALIAPHVGRAAPAPRQALVLALPAAALISTWGPGAALWLAPPLVVVAASWVLAARRGGDLRVLATTSGALVAATVLLALPTLLLVSRFLATDDALVATATGPSRSAEALGALIKPLSPFQLAGIWPIGDFRLVAPTLPTAILVTLAAACAVGTAVASIRRREWGIALYAAMGILGVVAVKLAGGSPWAVAKALAVGSPALLVAALAGAALLLARSRAAGALVVALLVGGVLWSNVLAYHDVRLASRPRLAELQKIGAMIAGEGPTLLNEHEIYGTRHFLRAGDPTAPTDFRDVPLPVRSGEALGVAAQADLDAFPLRTVLAFRTIVMNRSPTHSRPPFGYRIAWQGRWYVVWQRGTTATEIPVVHAPGGDSNVLPYCGLSQRGYANLCPIVPASPPPCSAVRRLRSIARQARGRLVAFERPVPIVIRAASARYPAGWEVDLPTARVTPNASGTMTFDVRLAAAGRYRVWLGGTFGHGVQVSVDGRSLGRVRGERLTFASYDEVGTVRLAKGPHTIALRFQRGGLAPGSGTERSTLQTMALEPLDAAPARMLEVAPADAARLCGRTLDWIEVVRPVA